ncbi:unnamed protein product (plasmid) [Mycetohabitans rhizoxinica HKI 454]|uniref:Uncharacterized protein n=1 Tax=Mycetohabitans rhizoxinica (strain DSM 19002 / CIP 109453 / HKI 454) TaxID=882378 RepID=E5AUW5_MYCRK|nr:unnamed protein product [Mycetohabitans rhizoxinica HKI 454]
MELDEGTFYRRANHWDPAPGRGLHHLFCARWAAANSTSVRLLARSITRTLLSHRWRSNRTRYTWQQRHERNNSSTGVGKRTGTRSGTGFMPASFPNGRSAR